jgi:hypothetical protein
MNLSTVRGSVLAFGIAGCLFFTLAFAVSFASPNFVEQIAKDLIRYQVEKTVHEKVESLDAGLLAKKAEIFAKGYGEEIALAKRQLSEQLPARIADVIAEMQNLDCECRNKIETTIRKGFEWQIMDASQAQERLTTLIRSKYMETATQLTREYRIFTGTNAVVFALLVFAVLLKRQAGLHLLPSAAVLFVAASITAYLYLFNQNWLHTIVFSDYTGFAYIGYLSVVFAFLCDIIFNSGRVTVEVLGSLLQAIGSAIQIAPC